MKISIIVTKEGLIPKHQSDLDQLKKVAINTEVFITAEQPRNTSFHRKVFALLRLVLDNAPDYFYFNGKKERMPQTVEKLLDWLKIKTGFFSFKIVSDELHLHPDSIAFENMNEEDFQIFYSRCMDIIVGDILEGLSPETIEEEYKNYL